MKEKLFITDLDGTLLQPDATLSDYSKEKILEILAKDIHFTVATARSVTSTKEILGDIPFKLPVICGNGGSIYNYNPHELLHVEYIPQGLVADIIHETKLKNDSAFVSSLENGQEKVHYDELHNYAMNWFYEDRVKANDLRLNQIEDIRERAGETVTSITFMNRKHHLEKTKKYFLKKYNTQIKLNFFENKYSPGWYWLSIHSAAASKGNAIQKLKKFANLHNAHVTVFGDEMNDLSMFEIAEHPIAVGNALQKVKNNAKEIIDHNHQNAVVDYVLGNFQ